MYITKLTIFCHFSAISKLPEKLEEVPSLLQEYESYLANKTFDEAKKQTKKCIISLHMKKYNRMGAEDIC